MMEGILKKLRELLARQDAFAGLLSELQRDLLAQMLANMDFVRAAPGNVDVFFSYFNRDYYYPVLQQLINDVEFVLDENVTHFSGQVGIDAKRTGLIAEVRAELVNALGFTESGDIASSGMFNDVLRDTSIQRDVRTYLAKQLTSERLAPSQIADLKGYLTGNVDRQGIYESYFNRPDRTGGTLFDTYQKADRLAQNTFAEALDMSAALYVGGLIDGSRPFCIERNGKVWLLSEIDAWKNLKFQGKPAYGYEPRTDLGGYRCRHHLRFLSNSTALRLDKTLELYRGNLRRIKK